MNDHSDQVTMEGFGQIAAPPDPLPVSKCPPGDKKPTLEQWKELYKVAQNIRKLAPWDHLWESELITIMLPGYEEPIYCSVMGRGGECYAIGIYPGYESINSFYRLSEAAQDNPPFAMAFEQDCLACHFGDREDVTSEERETYKALGLRFRGRNEWIYFRSMEPGYIPWYINAGQADLLIQALQNFAMALTYLLGEKIEVDFDGGETLLRFYSPEKELWLNAATKMPPRPIITPKLIVDNEILMAQLKKQKLNGTRLEFELTYLPTPIQEHKGDKPYLPRMALLMDKTSGLPLDQHMADKGGRIEVDILEMLTQYIMKFGKPVSINIRDDSTGCYIEDFCQKAGVKLIQGKGVPAVDRFRA
jgi:hypothetical protein